MANVTVRNIPDELLNKLRILSVLEKRSLNSEILIAIEKGMANESMRSKYGTVNPPKDTQLKLWRGLCGRWKDHRDTDKIISDIIGSRSEGRSVDL